MEIINKMNSYTPGARFIYLSIHSFICLSILPILTIDLLEVFAVVWRTWQVTVILEAPPALCW